MLRRYRIILRAHSLTICLGLLLFIIGFYLGSARVNRSSNQSSSIAGITRGEFNLQPSAPTPVLDLPLNYFPLESFRGGTGLSDDKYKWESANIDAGYQSFPTTTIRIPGTSYTNEIEQLPAPKSKETILTYSNIYADTFNEQLIEYGEFSKRFLPEHTITGIEKFDVDNDGKNEYIIGVCELGGNHCPQKVVIVKEGKIIFSTVAGVSDTRIVETGTSNGFYLEWVPSADIREKWGAGLCCSIGYIRTRFVLEGQKFVPVYEQELLYIKVKNSDQPDSEI